MIMLKIEGIPGTSDVPGHIGALPLHNYAWELAREPGAVPQFQQLVVQKHAGISGSPLWLHTANGRVIDSMILSVIQTDGDIFQEYLTIEFTRVSVRGFSETHNDDERPMQTISFDYGTIKTTFRVFDGHGKVVGTYISGWDLVREPISK